MVQPCRMQVTTSCRTRRPGTWNSTSLVTTVRTLRRGGHGHQLVQPELVARPAAQGQRQMRPVAEDVRHPAQPAAAGRIGLVGHEHGDQALGVDWATSSQPSRHFALPPRRLPSDSSRQRRP